MQGLSERFLSAIVGGDFVGALSAAQAAHERGLPFLYEEVVARALAEVGRLWQEGRLSVADEHVATALTQSVLASFYPSFPWPETGPSAVVACVAGERHELGARMAADLLACDGWNVRFVGADVPLEALLELVIREHPVFVGLSAALSNRLPSVREVVARLRLESPSTKVLVGGRAFATEGVLGLVEEVDELARSAVSAVELIRSWKP